MLKERMTPAQAALFDRYSASNAAQVKQSLACGCEPYRDVFTYGRWQAQGYQVQRGQHAIKIPIIKRVESEDKDTGEIRERKLFGTGAVFCRHQVQPVNGAVQLQPAQIAAGAGVARQATMIAPAQAPVPTGPIADIMNTWREI